MSEKTSEKNGDVAAGTIPQQTTAESWYRMPSPSTSKVYQHMVESLTTIVTSAMREAEQFIRLTEPSYGIPVDDRPDTATRLGHLVDATECLEIAMTHLGQAKSVLSYRLRTEDETNVASSYWPAF